MESFVTQLSLLFKGVLVSTMQVSVLVFLILVVKALLRGRFNVSCEDVRAVSKPVMRHRMFTNFNADAEGVKPDDLVEMLIKAVPEPSVKDYAGQAAKT